MISSFLGLLGTSCTMLPGREWPIGSIEDQKNNWRVSFVIVTVGLSFAVFLAPERPDQLASICEKHNPEIVCQVW